MHRNTSVHKPVERVMNSIGLAPSRSVNPNSTMRASGYHAATNTAIFAGVTQPAAAEAGGRLTAAVGAGEPDEDAARVSGSDGEEGEDEAMTIPAQKFFFRSMP
jgi:hypothetical protein